MRAKLVTGSLWAALLVLLIAAWLSPAQAPAQTPLYVGLRRSSYGLRKKNGDDAWWAERAKAFAAHFPRSQPVILQILSNYQDDGTTQIEFPRPDGYTGPTTNMTFRRGNKLNHERALAMYDAQGVKAILQFEPGSADVGDCFALAHAAFGRHPCVIGLAIDGEWFRTRESPDQAGLPMTDTDAQHWMKQVFGLNTNYLLVLKHFESKKLPPTYRHPNLWLLTDSQEFASRDDWIADMRAWEAAFKGSHLGAQFGYPKDRKWWARSAQPPVELGTSLAGELSDYRLLLWVDFTADQVPFGAN